MNVIITGASRGIGKSIAMKFAQTGHNLLLCSRHINLLEKTVEDLKLLYPAVMIKYREADLSDKSDAESFGDWCLLNSPLDILVNNAGIFLGGNTINEPAGQLEKMISTNLYGAYHLTRKVVPAMIRRREGHIFNICSVASLEAYNNGGSYSISKFALNGFSKNLRHELKDFGIKVTAVFPGAVYTDSWEGYDNSDNRIMEARDISEMIYACTALSAQAVVEEIVLRPQLGDL